MTREQPVLRKHLLHFAVLGLVQGLALVFLNLHAVTAFAGPNVTLAARMFVVLAPGLLMLLVQRARWREPAIFAAAMALVVALVYLWAESRFGVPHSKFDDILFPAIVVAMTVSTVALPLFQVWLAERRTRIPYPPFFEHAWNNVITFAVGGLFVGAAWLLLWLWASLFALVNIDFFEDLFSVHWFALPFSGLAVGLSLAVIRSHERIVRSIRDLALALFAVLAPILAIALILFLAVLPFSGLEPLWGTGHATGVLFIVAIGAVFLVNAVIRDGAFGPPPRFMALLLGVQLVIAPVFAGLAAYATMLRVGQYGLTPDRVYGFVFAGCAALWTVAYAYAAIRWRAAWPDAVRRQNPVLGIGTALLALAVLTPVLDPYALSAGNQFNRLASGQVVPAEFDFGLMKFKLGASGRTALERIRTDDSLPQRQEIDRNLAILDQSTRYGEWQRNVKRREEYGDSPERIFESFLLWPAGQAPDPAFRQFLLSSKRDILTGCAKRTPAICALLAADLVGGAPTEYVFARRNSRYNIQFYGFRRDGETWKRFDHWRFDGADASEAWDAIKRGAVTVAASQHRVLRLGDRVLPLSPRQ